MIRRYMIVAAVALTAAALFILASVAGIRHTTTAWRPQPPPPPSPSEYVCVDMGLAYDICYLVHR